MTPSRLKTVFKIIVLAFSEGRGDVVKQAISYGSSFRITKEEIKEVLRMPLPYIYANIYRTKKTTIPICIDTQEDYPVTPHHIEY